MKKRMMKHDRSAGCILLLLVIIVSTVCTPDRVYAAISKTQNEAVNWVNGQVGRGLIMMGFMVTSV